MFLGIKKPPLWGGLRTGGAVRLEGYYNDNWGAAQPCHSAFSLPAGLQPSQPHKHTGPLRVLRPQLRDRPPPRRAATVRWPQHAVARAPGLATEMVFGTVFEMVTGRW